MGEFGTELSTASVLGYRVASQSLTQTINVLLQRLQNGQVSRVYLANVHMLMEAQQSAALHQALQQADFLLADGRPLCWWHRLINGLHCQQVRGYDLVLALLQSAQQHHLKVALYGGQCPAALDQLLAVLSQRFPQLHIVYSYAPPMAPAASLAPEQQQLLAASQADILLVGLGCPKQELFIYQYSDQLPKLQIGVGAVFDYIAGRRALPPAWAARCGLEWLFRWAQEPGRLSSRYLRYNPQFVVKFLKAWISK